MAIAQATHKRLSPFHHKQSSIDAKFVVDEFGWARAESFTAPDKEKLTAEKGVGIADLSRLTKFSLSGNGLMRFISKQFSGAGDDAKGRVLMNGQGSFRDAFCALFSGDEALLIADESRKEDITSEVNANKPEHVTLVDVSSTLAGTYIIGPNSRRLLRRLTELNVNDEDFPNHSATYTPIRHVPAAILRNDVGSLAGYQLFFERAYAEYVWDALFAAGNGLDATPLGSAAMKLLGAS